ncbi:MAG: L,D-transpeptidase family protein [Pseudomonadota bacterium]
MKRYQMMFVVLLALVMLPMNVQAQDAETSPILKLIQKGRIDGVRLKYPDALQYVYKENNYQPLFVKGERRDFNRVNEFYEIFLDSWVHGFNPGRYNTPALYDFLRKDKSDITDEERLKTDIILSDAIIRYGRNLTGGRVSAKSVGLHKSSVKQGAVPENILAFVSSSRSPHRALQSFAPQGKFYQTLQNELIRLYQNPDANVKPIRVGRIIKPRTSHSAIPKIRERLGLSDSDLAHEATFYDDALSGAVVAFQNANGLEPDGVIGPSTMHVLNITNEQKIKQIIVNMERMRWQEEDKPPRYIMVNIPSETLWAVDRGRTEIQMPVVVGTPKRPTKSFVTNITGVRINPTWTIPPTIKKEDFVSKLKEDANYLQDRGIKLYHGKEPVDATLVDWTAAEEAGELGQFRMVQGSGSSNPLGKYRVIMNNPYNIYLHDTPKKSLFSRSNRALSSGCVRLQDAEAVVDFIMEKNDDWSEEKKQNILAKGKLREVYNEEPLPVYLQYQTMWLGDSDNLVFGRDIYKEDAILFSQLKKQGDIYLPEDRGI